jgi:hypothetical protein
MSSPEFAENEWFVDTKNKPKKKLWKFIKSLDKEGKLLLKDENAFVKSLVYGHLVGYYGSDLSGKHVYITKKVKLIFDKPITIKEAISQFEYWMSGKNDEKFIKYFNLDKCFEDASSKYRGIEEGHIFLEDITIEGPETIEIHTGS